MGSSQHTNLSSMRDHLQVRIHSWNARCVDGIWQRGKPALGLPHSCIRTPQRWISVRRKDADNNFRSLRYRNLVHISTICAANRLGEWHHNVFQSSKQRLHDQSQHRACRNRPLRYLLSVDNSDRSITNARVSGNADAATLDREIAHSRSVSRQTASRYGRSTNVSYGISCSPP